MNIAVSTTDGKTICGHLGKCRDFIIYEIDGGEIKGKRLISSGGACPGHGDEGSHNIGPFHGCQAVITQGMGQGMLDGLAQAGIQPVITGQSDPDTAVMDFLRGELSGTTKSSCSCGEH
jgi:predicted Fe-Mo cluster-binding NifX family protein